MNLTPKWKAVMPELVDSIHGQHSTPESRKHATETLMDLAEKLDRQIEDQKRSLWSRITAEELAAEGLVLMPRSLLCEGQIDELIAWLRKAADNDLAEARELEEFGKRRDGKNVLAIGRP
jgi:hypothetical protein